MITRLNLAVVAALALIPATAGAQTVYVLVEGTKQGLFANESPVGNHPNRLVGRDFDYLVKVPRDAATGMVSGKRQHGPVVLTREWGAASPQLFQALFSNEILKAVTFEFYQTNKNGEEELGGLVKLTNATVVEIHQHGVASSGGALHAISSDTRRLEDVSFSFTGIEIQHPPGKTMAADQLGLR
jgi:type VI secretion system secreted protein Hcp